MINQVEKKTLQDALADMPAPWLSNESDCLSISDVNGSSIAEMQCPADVEEALARLMTAAPALYAALKPLASEPVSDSSLCHSGITTKELCPRCARILVARAAIALAEGK